MKAHRLAFLLLGIALGLPLSLLGARLLQGRSKVIEMHASVAEGGGWFPENLTAEVGVPLHLRLTSNDVMHGFALGQSDIPALDIEPGRVVETTLTFSRPGRYVFYCTRWCGANHWRMRGTIEVTGPADTPAPSQPPLYLALGLDLDAPRRADPVPAQRPSAARGADLSRTLPASLLHVGDLKTQSPMQIWQRLRAAPETRSESDQDLWDVVAFLWRSSSTPEAIKQGRALFAANCAACHGESGGGDGVMAGALTATQATEAPMGHARLTPANFRDLRRMLAASPALLQGKILRGGMGTGMPYWGPIFTEPQTWALVDYLWSLAMDYEEVR